MKEFLPATCPVSAERVDERVVRIIALEVITLITVALLTGFWFIFLQLGLDFTLRAFTSGKGSMLKFFAKNVVRLLQVVPKPVDAAPKRFAALLGAGFSITTAILLLFHLKIAAFVSGGTLIGGALLEGVAGYCAGCFVYARFVLPFQKGK